MPARTSAVMWLIAIILPVSRGAGPSLVFQNTFGQGQLNAANAVAVDTEGNVYTAGGQSQPGNSATSAGFVAKWSPDGGKLLYSTAFGGSGLTIATGIAIDASGSAYVTGYTSSTDFPVSANAFQRTLTARQSAFVIKFSADGSTMLYSTLLGGSQAAQASAIAVELSGNAVITGQTQGGNFPVTSNAFQASPVAGCASPPPWVNVASSGDAFVTIISPDGSSLVYSTLLGGSWPLAPPRLPWTQPETFG